MTPSQKLFPTCLFSILAIVSFIILVGNYDPSGIQSRLVLDIVSGLVIGIPAFFGILAVAFAIKAALDRELYYGLRLYVLIWGLAFGSLVGSLLFLIVSGLLE